MINERRVAERLMIEIRRFIPHKADCWTLLCDFYRECYGIELPRYEYRSIKVEKPPAEVWKDWRIIGESEARPGDVLLFYPEKNELHLGIVLDKGDFVHATYLGNPPVRIGPLVEVSSDIPIKYVRYRTFDNH